MPVRVVSVWWANYRDPGALGGTTEADIGDESREGFGDGLFEAESGMSGRRRKEENHVEDHRVGLGTSQSVLPGFCEG